MVHDNCTNTICGTELSQAASLSWRGWFQDGKRLMTAEFTRAVTLAFALMLMWRHRACVRRHLITLDAHLLADVGLTRAQALKEAQKPFWVE